MIVCNEIDKRCVLYMLRYGMTRMTGAIDDVQQVFLENIDSFKSYEVKKIIEEIKRHDKSCGLGMECDRASWYDFIGKLEKLI